VSRDKHEQAFAILVKYHGEGDPNSEFAKAEMAEIKTTIATELEYSRQSWMDMVRSAGMRRRVLIGSLLGLFSQLSGNVVISYYLGDSLKLIGYTDSNFQAEYNLGNQVWSLLCGVSAALVVMRFKRRTMYLTGILSILAVYVAWTVCSAIFAENKSPVAAKLSLFWIYAYSPAYNTCFNALTYSELFAYSYARGPWRLTCLEAFLVELFPYAQRARGLAIFQFFGKGAQFFGTNVNPVGM